MLPFILPYFLNGLICLCVSLSLFNQKIQYVINNVSFSDLRQNMLVSCVFVSCSVLAPLMWHLWIILGTANSNYYFGTTLAYNTGQVINVQTNLIYLTNILLSLTVDLFND